MHAQVLSVRDGPSLRQIVAIDVLWWNLRVGLSVAPRDLDKARQHKRLRKLRLIVPRYLHKDVGLPPEEVPSSIADAIVHYLMR
jgi:hypothetical protein